MFLLDVSDGRSFSSERVQTCKTKKTGLKCAKAFSFITMEKISTQSQLHIQFLKPQHNSCHQPGLRIAKTSLDYLRSFSLITSNMKSTIRLLGLRSSCWKRTLRISPSRASRTALQTHSLWQTSSRPVSLTSCRGGLLIDSNMVMS